MPKSKSRRIMPSAAKLQDMELNRQGYTRKSGGTKRTQASQLNRNKKAKSGS